MDEKDKRIFKALSTTGVYPKPDKSLGHTQAEKERVRVAYLT